MSKPNDFAPTALKLWSRYAPAQQSTCRYETVYLIAISGKATSQTTCRATQRKTPPSGGGGRRPPRPPRDPAASALSRRGGELLRKLRDADNHGIFHHPVPADLVPGYRDVVARPMDFSTCTTCRATQRRTMIKTSIIKIILPQPSTRYYHA
jgi:hypothetical protein